MCVYASTVGALFIPYRSFAHIYAHFALRAHAYNHG